MTHADLAFLRLLRGRVEAAVRCERPVVALAQGPSGTWNTEGLFPEDEKKPRAKKKRKRRGDGDDDEVAIRAETNPLYTQITVCDTGPGFAEADLPHLFTRFYRGRNAGEGGVGIGLAMARSIAQTQGGTLTARNAPGFFPKILYKGRARIEQTMGKLKRFKRIALRCEKTAENYASLVAFACALILAKSVHTA